MESLGKSLKLMRNRAKMSQLDISRMLGVSRTTYASWENGKTSPTVDFVVTLANFYKVSADFLIFGDDKKETF